MKQQADALSSIDSKAEAMQRAADAAASAQTHEKDDEATGKHTLDVEPCSLPALSLSSCLTFCSSLTLSLSLALALSHSLPSCLPPSFPQDMMQGT